jgi:NitT/TauT family transport system ATP-binding protein
LFQTDYRIKPIWETSFAFYMAMVRYVCQIDGLIGNLGGAALLDNKVREGASGLSVRGLEKTFYSRSGNVTALTDVTFDMRRGEFLSIIGPSGCGKSTVMRVLGGLDNDYEGHASIHGEDPNELRKRHRIGVAFQDSAMLPWRTVRKNLALPYQISRERVNSGDVEGLLKLVGLESFGDAYPSQLSGGMRQRASIARALARDPEVLLLDEPFGALDDVTRQRMNFELQRIWTASEPTTLMVTHSIPEAVLLSDRIIVMTGRPGTISTIIDVPIPRLRTPETLRTPEYHRLVDEISAKLFSSEAGAE